jgi:predicted RNA-binding protein YlqC (UPF0109 family)
MEKLIKFLLSSIITNKDVKVEVEESDGNLVRILIRPEAADAGILIGKEGKVISSITRILKIKATLAKKKVVVKVEPLVNS